MPAPELRVLVVTNMYPTPDSPMAGIFVAEQVRSLRERGLVVEVLAVDGRKGRSEYLRGFGRVRRATRRGDFDLIHAHYVFSGLMALAQRAIPVVLTHHGIETQQGWTAPLCRLTSRFVARTIVTSTRVRAALRRPDADIVPCGVDLSLFAPISRAAARQELGLPDDRPLILFAGMRRPEKRFDLVQAAVGKLQAGRRPEAQLVVAEAEAHERMPLFMSACDVLVLASQAEGSPMVIKEAMACNLPIVSVDVGDVAEIVRNIDGCYLSDSTSDDLAVQLTRALDFGRRTAGREAILHLSLEAVAERLEAIYRQVVSGKGPNRRRGGRSGERLRPDGTRHEEPGQPT